MNSTKSLLAAFAMGIVVAAALPVIAEGEAESGHKSLMKMADSSPDGKVTKSQVMKHVDNVFDRQDTRKEGKLDRKQLDAFLKQFTAQSGA